MSDETLPAGWVVTELGDICAIHDSRRIPINATERNARIAGKSDSELYPYYGATGEVGKIDGFLFDGEYVLIGEDGAPFLEPHRGVSYLVNGRFWVNNHAHILEHPTSNRFLCHYLKQIDYRPFVTGTTRLKLNQAQLRKIPVPLPPLPEQKRIVAKIEELSSELEAGEESLRVARRQLGVYRQSLLKQAFEGKLTEKWRTQNLAKLGLPDDLIARAPGAPNLPDKWRSITLGESCKMYQPRTISTAEMVEGGAYPVYGANGVIGSYDKFNHEESQVLVTCRGATCGAVNVSRPFSWINGNAMVVQPLRHPIEQKFLVYLFTGGIQINKAISGTAQPQITRKSLDPLSFPYCSLPEQQEIVRLLDAQFEVIEQNEREIDAALQRSETLRQAILKKAFTGRLVPQDPADESASALLARLRLEREATPPARRR